jgi:hypothetical protein
MTSLVKIDIGISFVLFLKVGLTLLINIKVLSVLYALLGKLKEEFWSAEIWGLASAQLVK